MKVATKGDKPDWFDRPVECRRRQRLPRVGQAAERGLQQRRGRQSGRRHRIAVDDLHRVLRQRDAADRRVPAPPVGIADGPARRAVRRGHPEPPVPPEQAGAAASGAPGNDSVRRDHAPAAAARRRGPRRNGDRRDSPKKRGFWSKVFGKKDKGDDDKKKEDKNEVRPVTEDPEPFRLSCA